MNNRVEERDNDERRRVRNKDAINSVSGAAAGLP